MGLIPKGFDSHGNKRALKRKLIPMGLIPKGFDSQGIWLPWEFNFIINLLAYFPFRSRT